MKYALLVYDAAGVIGHHRLRSPRLTTIGHRGWSRLHCR